MKHVMDNVLASFLRHQFEQGKALAADSDLLQLLPVDSLLASPTENNSDSQAEIEADSPAAASEGVAAPGRVSGR